MWSNNALTERLQLEWPILQAPMGDITTPALAAAVSNAGGLGGLGMWGFSAEEAERRIAGFRQLSGGALNVNYPLWEHPGHLEGRGAAMRTRLEQLYEEKALGPVPEPTASVGEVGEEHLSVLIRARPELVSFHFGLPPTAVLRTLQEAGVFVISSATTVREAKLLEGGGVDAIIAQGVEAGGHRGTFTDVPVASQPGLFALLPQVVDAVKVPVIAAGGVADGRGIAAALMLGASAVQLGTAFLRCEEAQVSAAHRAAVESAEDADTVVTNVITGRPARCVRNRIVETLSGETPLPFPAQSGWTGPLTASGDREMASLYAGQAVALSREASAGDLVKILAAETGERLRSLA